MKKQILILVVAFLAISFSNAFGQAKIGSLPQALSCTPDPYHPIPGIPYDYEATVSPIGGNAYWFATKKGTFMASDALMPTTDMETAAAVGSAVLSATNYMATGTAAPATTTTTITWTAAGLAAATVLPSADPKLFVGLYYDGTACADNLKVYPIRPVNAFIVDIKNLDQTEATQAYGDNVQTCFSKIASATFKTAGGTGDGTIVYDFGTNILYFEVVAANFSGAYTPTLRLAGLDAGGLQTADIEWGIKTGTGVGAYDQTLTTGTGNGDYTISGGITADASVTDISKGASIYVRVTVHNNSFEGTALEPITLAVEAVNEASQSDVDNLTCAAPASTFEDVASQDLLARPSATEVAPNVFLKID